MTGEQDRHDQDPSATISSARGFVLCVLLWVAPGHEHELAGYEDTVLALLPAHGGRVRERLRGEGLELAGPNEVQLLEFPSEAAFAAFMDDPRRAALADVRTRAIARTDVFRMRPG